MLHPYTKRSRPTSLCLAEMERWSPNAVLPALLAFAHPGARTSLSFQTLVPLVCRLLSWSHASCRSHSSHFRAIPMQEEWESLKKCLPLGRDFEQIAIGKLKSASSKRTLQLGIESIVGECRASRKLHKCGQAEDDLSDHELSRLSRFTDSLPLCPYEKILHLTPRLVNIVSARIVCFFMPRALKYWRLFSSFQVTLAEAIPAKGTNFTLPLDLHYIASRCRNSYYAPRRFAAVRSSRGAHSPSS